MILLIRPILTVFLSVASIPRDHVVSAYRERLEKSIVFDKDYMREFLASIENGNDNATLNSAGSVN